MSGEDFPQLYVMAHAESGPCKIGIAKDHEIRRRSVQTGNPNRLTTVWLTVPCHASAKLERQVHTLLADRRLNGEWFEVTVAEASAAVTMPQMFGDADIQAILKARGNLGNLTEAIAAGHTATEKFAAETGHKTANELEMLVWRTLTVAAFLKIDSEKLTEIYNRWFASDLDEEKEKGS